MIFNLDVNKENDYKLKFILYFENDEVIPVVLPITSFNHSGQAVGINIFADTKKIKPIRQASTYLIDPTAEDMTIDVGGSIFIEWDADIKKFGEQWGLELDNVTFILEPNTTYTIFVHWDKYRSNDVEWTFSQS